ncbi:hypothetical protein B0I35DRAFT_444895 [Stachybotrys elegans]|uniref:AttH domain-containing protein n=1 Tax=Stachybotrys elegans TaxID=80388 RepID=A0A8K0WLN5_9HYPO|nr:hypothetical protein B0I35DRAFT_444895 [Stachybotrys elegans]
MSSATSWSPAASSVGFLPPDNGSFTWNGQLDQLPLSFNISDSQYRGEIQIDGSCWVNSFIHGSNGHSYYVAAQVMDYASQLPGALPAYRASLLDVTEPSLYRNYIRHDPEGSGLWTSEGDFRARYDGFGMEATGEDPLQGIHIYSSIAGIDFDLTFNFTSPVLLNAALGSYWVGGALGWQWSLPRGATEGSLTIDGEKIDVVSEKSFSWYDRQWGSLQASINWVMVHFEESDWLDISVMSVWYWTDPVNGPKEFATIRSSRNSRDSVVPISVAASTTNVWTSPETGITYPQEWLLVLDDIEMVVKSPRPDQVIETPPGTIPPSQFSGYVDIIAKKAGHASVKGFGAVDRVTIAEG